MKCLKTILAMNQKMATIAPFFTLFLPPFSCSAVQATEDKPDRASLNPPVSSMTLSPLQNREIQNFASTTSPARTKDEKPMSSPHHAPWLDDQMNGFLDTIAEEALERVREARQKAQARMIQEGKITARAIRPEEAKSPAKQSSLPSLDLKNIPKNEAQGPETDRNVGRLSSRLRTPRAHSPKYSPHAGSPLNSLGNKSSPRTLFQPLSGRGSSPPKTLTPGEISPSAMQAPGGHTPKDSRDQ